MRKIVFVLFLLVVVALFALFATPYASAQSNAQPLPLTNPLLPPPGVEDLYVHITRVGFLDYRDPSGWDVHFDVIGGPARPYPHLYQKVIVTASKPDETTRRYIVVYDANLTRYFTLSIVGPEPRVKPGPGSR